MRILAHGGRLAIGLAVLLVAAGIAVPIWLVNAVSGPNGGHRTLVSTQAEPAPTPGPPPALPPGLIHAVQQTGQAIQVSAAGAEASASVQTAEEAALAENPPGSAVMAASLVKVVLLSHGITPLLAWGIEIDPAGGEHSVGAPGVPVYPGNYRLDIVSAQTGAWLAAFAGHAASLPSLPPLPHPAQ